MNRIRALCLFVVLLIGLGNVALVAAHADYESSVPAAGATVANAPAQVKTQ
jgi:methionine-rich copper-binding protein CopC